MIIGYINSHGRIEIPPTLLDDCRWSCIGRIIRMMVSHLVVIQHGGDNGDTSIRRGIVVVVVAVIVISMVVVIIVMMRMMMMIVPKQPINFL